MWRAADVDHHRAGIDAGDGIGDDERHRGRGDGRRRGCRDDAVVDQEGLGADRHLDVVAGAGDDGDGVGFAGETRFGEAGVAGEGYLGRAHAAGRAGGVVGHEVGGEAGDFDRREADRQSFEHEESFVAEAGMARVEADAATQPGRGEADTHRAHRRGDRRAERRRAALPGGDVDGAGAAYRDAGAGLLPECLDVGAAGGAFAVAAAAREGQ